ncbi:alpha/beta fold hydrolase [Aureispira anguillae]|uniref:Alpha/beta hydrolase n=1 Tax=Aureispira anguillae TaxID=2864201 RepID=A0A915YFT9_9BACT|nr:alpha/beta hydrolase [Aureispira anguillae]BDS12240.1 alpha/beta hydrolase [Aureispira anguillae]
MPTTIYKSAQAKKKILALYQQKLDALKLHYKETQIETKAGKTNVIVVGSEQLPPVVLLHGVNVGAPIALEAIQGLAQHFCIYAIDILGQPNRSEETRLPLRDNSYGKWLVEVLDALALERVALIGVSYGGFILQRLIACAPERIERAIFIVPAGFTNGSALKAIFKVLIPMRRYLKSRKKQDLHTFMDAFCAEKDAYLVAYQEAVLEGIYMDTRRPPLLTKKEAQKLDAPVYILAAEDDVFFPGNQTIKKAQRLFKNLQKTILMENAKHVPAGSDYEMIEQYIAGFLRD